MLAVFPTLLPEEPVYSAVARYADMMRLRGHSQVRRVVFGARKVTPSVELPAHLDALVARLPLGHGYTVDELLQRHTALPYYRAFLPADAGARLEREMRAPGTGAPLRGVGRARRWVPEVRRLRYCAGCAADDRAAHGVPYWRRAHQLAGVVVCPAHGTALRESGVSRGDAVGAVAFVSLAAALAGGEGAELAVPPDRLDVARAVARDTAWLLQHGPEAARAGGNPGVLWEAYEHLMRAAGWGHLSAERTAAAASVLGPDVLLALSGASEGSALATDARVAGAPAERWLGEMLRNRRFSRLPILHLLLLYALGSTAEQLFSGRLRGRVEPDVAALDAPCGNPVCAAYDPPVPRELPRDQVGSARRVVVTCPRCGFRYTQRRVPGRSAGMPYKRVLATGPLWDARLRALVRDPDARWDTFEAALGMGLERVQRHAYRLGVWHPRWAESARLAAQRAHHAAELEAEQQGAPSAATRDAYRKRWTALRAAHPHEGRTGLQRRDRRAYTALRRWDRAWLFAHMPPTRSLSRGRPAVDWAARDAVLLPRVCAAAKAIRAQPGRPVQVTAAAVGRVARCSAALRTHLGDMPQTRAFLAAVVEDAAAFARRRIAWAARDCVMRGAVATRQVLQREYGFGFYLLQAHAAFVADAVRDAAACVAHGAPLGTRWTALLAPAPWEADAGAAGTAPRAGGPGSSPAPA